MYGGLWRPISLGISSNLAIRSQKKRVIIPCMQHACDFFFFLSSQQKLSLAQCLAIICAWRVRDPCAYRPHTDQRTWVTSRTYANYAPVLYNPLLIRLLRQCSSLHSIEWNTIISLLQHVYFFFFLSVPSVLLAHPSSTKMSTAPSTAQYVAV